MSEVDRFYDTPCYGSNKGLPVLQLTNRILAEVRSYKGTRDIGCKYLDEQACNACYGSASPCLHLLDERNIKPIDEQKEHGFLTITQRKILVLSGQGMTSEEIAERLVNDVQTVKNHKTDLFKRIGVSGITEAVIYALATEVIHPDEILYKEKLLLIQNLTPAERDLLKVTCHMNIGTNYESAATELDVKLPTVRSNVTNLLKKLSLRNTTQAAAHFFVSENMYRLYPEFNIPENVVFPDTQIGKSPGRRHKKFTT